MKVKSEKLKKGIVYLVGAGPGDPGLLTLRGAELLMEADVIIYDRLVGAPLLEWNSHAEKIYAGKHSSERTQKPPQHFDQTKINRLMVKLALQGKKVVRLKGGDPFIFGRGGEEALYLKEQGVPFEVIPGISAGTGVPAYAGIPLTDRRFASQVTLVTGHEEAHKAKTSVAWDHLAQSPGTIVSFMAMKNLAGMVKALIRGGKTPDTGVCVIENGTLPEQRVIEGSLADIVAKVRVHKIRSPALTVIGEVTRLRKKLAWFEKKPLYGRTVLITRARAQAGSLKKILLQRGARVLEFPAIEIVPPESWGPLDRSLAKLQEYHWVVFTSVNGVENVFERIHRMGKDSRIFAKTKIAAIGQMTEAALKEHGLRVDLRPERYTSEALAEKLEQSGEVAGRSFLLPRADIAPVYLRLKLQELRARVTEVVAYRTRPSDAARKELHQWLKEEPIDYVLFTSRSTVQSFFQAVPKKLKRNLKTRFVSIGPVTSGTLRHYGVHPFREAREHTVNGLVEVLAHAGK